MTHMYFSARAEGRISYGHLGRTDSCCYCRRWKSAAVVIGDGGRLEVVVATRVLGNCCAMTPEAKTKTKDFLLLPLA